MLKEIYPETIHSYRSKLYPFNCDFYIPNLNMYIEYNGSWTHGKHPYSSENQDDINILEKWKTKNTKYYNNAIYTWTVRDIRKRSLAKENNLNYIELWNMHEALEFVEQLKNNK